MDDWNGHNDGQDSELAELLATMTNTDLHHAGTIFEVLNSKVEFKLLQLPGEVLNNIFEHLDDGSLARCRVVGHKMTDHSAFTFDTRLFGVIITVLHTDSLDILCNISNFPALSK
jgi:hypothetical protein